MLKILLPEYLPAGRQVGKRIRSNTLFRFMPGRVVEIYELGG